MQGTVIRDMGRQETVDTLMRVDLATPAFVIDLDALQANARAVREQMGGGQARLLFALKSFSVVAGLKAIAPQLDGFAASSLFEARLARSLAQAGQSVHVTTPGLRPDEMSELCEVADYISFNSLSQWQRHRQAALGKVACGLRVNPQLSFVEDARYDPCRPHSKLGVPLDTLAALLHDDPGQLDGISGLHFHSNCDATDLAPLLATVERLLDALDPLFDRITWINLGGGYLLNAMPGSDGLEPVKARLRQRGSYRLFMEPGAAIARSAGYFVSTVVDLFDSGGQLIAVLDTSTNHMPEVFEYQFRPPVAGATDSGAHRYLLAGSACLAGDLFGEYTFDRPLQVGARVLFPDRGAYSQVKAHMFNGINLPSLYALDGQGRLATIRHYAFEDFLRLCGGE